MTVEVKVDGVEEVLRTLKNLAPSLAENALRQGVSAVAREVVNEGKVNLSPHRDTGELAASGRTSTRINRRRGSVTGKARFGGNDQFYATFLEFGTRYVAPVAFLERAGQRVAPRASGILSTRIRTNLPKIIARAKKRGII